MVQDSLFLVCALLAALGQPGLVVLFYNAVLSRMRESTLKKSLALLALPGGWMAAGVVAYAGLTGRARGWFLFEGNGFGDALLSAYLWGTAVGGLAVGALIALNPRREWTPREQRSNHTRLVKIPRRDPWPYGPGKRAFLALVAPINELNHIEVVRKEVQLPNLPGSFDGFRLIQLSDFHIGRTLGEEFFHGAIDAVNAESPDAVVLTGDFVSRSNSIPLIGSRLRGLYARDGVFYVRGNHDFWTRPEEVRRELDALGYKCLPNRATLMRRGAEAIALVGVEYPYSGGPSRWAELFPHLLPPCRIALLHTPDVIGPVARMGCDLAVAGHTHGGQIQFPFVGATLVPSSYGRRYAAGWKRVGRTLLYTNRGLGAFFPVRFLCPPEITVFILRCPRTKGTKGT